MFDNFYSQSQDCIPEKGDGYDDDDDEHETKETEVYYLHFN